MKRIPNPFESLMIGQFVKEVIKNGLEEGIEEGREKVKNESEKERIEWIKKERIKQIKKEKMDQIIMEGIAKNKDEIRDKIKKILESKNVPKETINEIMTPSKEN